MWDTLTEEKRAADGRAEERDYYREAGRLREALGETDAARLMQLTPQTAVRTGGRLSSRVPEAVVRELRSRRLLDDNDRLTFAGKYVLHYLRYQMQGLDIGGHRVAGRA